MRRTLLGMSQEKLGEAIGLTFQQVQKYERGSNRISAGTLYRLGQVLDVPVSFFFDCYDDPDGSRRSTRGDEAIPGTDGQISRREARLLRLWRAAPPHVSDELLALLSSLSPDQRDGADQTGDGHPANGRGEALALVHDGDGAFADNVLLAPPAAAVRPASRSVRGESTRGKAKTDGMKTDGAAGDKPRRRHGAVWDPADIMRAGKNTPRD
jgi:transcriptional regulator with XRE-family HTH domain